VAAVGAGNGCRGRRAAASSTRARWARTVSAWPVRTTAGVSGPNPAWRWCWWAPAAVGGDTRTCDNGPKRHGLLGTVLPCEPTLSSTARGRLLARIISPGQAAGDSRVLPALLAELRVNSHRPGQPRTTPISVRGDKAYSSRGHRTLLRSRGIRAVIPEPPDQVANRQRRGAAGGRPVSYDAEDYKPRKRRRTVLQPHEELARPG
jgi:hypothetical protein